MIHIEKAIEILKERSLFVADINLDAQISYKLAIEALEKEIPKLVLIEEDEINLFSQYCPVCKDTAWGYEKYCENCGQKLEWSED